MTFEPWLSVGGTLCENPLWDGRIGRVLWTDIDSGRVFSCALDSNEPELLYQGTSVGGFTMQEDGSLLLFRESDGCRLGVDGTFVKLFDFHHAGSKRFNDVVADPVGRVFAGTIGRGGGSGGLFLFERDGSYRMVAGGTDCSNGLGFSADGSTLYWTCSTRRVIFAFDYEIAEGRIDNRRVFATAGDGDGIPDGLAVDDKGNVFSARWGAAEFGMFVYDACGSEILRIRQPAKAVTSLCFAGANLDRIVATAATHGGDCSRTHDLFRLSGCGFRGSPENRSDFTVPRGLCEPSET
jgi:D-xylonolactonase